LQDVVIDKMLSGMRQNGNKLLFLCRTLLYSKWSCFTYVATLLWES